MNWCLSKLIRDPTPRDLPESALIVLGLDRQDERGRLELWSQLQSSGRSVWTVSLSKPDEPAEFQIQPQGQSHRIYLNDQQELRSLLRGHDHIVIDITTLSLGIWAPLLHAARWEVKTVEFTYVSTSGYRESGESDETNGWFDLSEECLGIQPLPGLAKISGPASDQQELFVPLLGFEGARASRFAFALENVKTIIPIVPHPGLLPHYGSWTIECNTEFLESSKSADSVRTIRANCPDAAYRVLRQIQQEYRPCYMNIGLIGTRPHCLGAVLFALDHPNCVELMYDWPSWKSGWARDVGELYLFTIKLDGQGLIQ